MWPLRDFSTLSFCMYFKRYLNCTPHHDEPPLGCFKRGRELVIIAKWLAFRIAFRILCQVSKSETELYDLFTPQWVMGPGYIAIGMRGPRDHGHKRVCYALVNCESPTRRLPLTTGSPPTAIVHRKTSVLRLLPIADDTGTVRSESTYAIVDIVNLYYRHP